MGSLLADQMTYLGQMRPMTSRKARLGRQDANRHFTHHSPSC